MKGKKIRIFASEFQSKAFERLGVTPVAMTLGDVLPAIQQGAIDGSIAGITVYTSMHYQDAAKYVTETGQPYIFLIVEISKKWYESLSPDLQQIVDKAAFEESVTINPIAVDYFNEARKQWVERGGELISLPPDEQSAMMATLSSVAEDVSQQKPELSAAYKLVADVAKRNSLDHHIRVRRWPSELARLEGRDQLNAWRHGGVESVDEGEVIAVHAVLRPDVADGVFGRDRLRRSVKPYPG